MLLLCPIVLQGHSSWRVHPLWLGGFWRRNMGYGKRIGQYVLSRTIGEGMFAKVKLAVNVSNGGFVAVKIIDKSMAVRSNLSSQIQSEIRTMKLLHHQNIVRIHEVIGTKTRIYIIMEYASGGRVLDKLAHARRLSDLEARKLFQQLIDAVDYCHNRGIYHRDLKPENLLLDGEGNLKVSDFGLSALHKPCGLLTTSCGSPCYMAPELLSNMVYDGAAADVWSCGVVLFELLAGYLPFNEDNLKMLYRKISRADYTCPPWFTQDQRRLIARILDPNSRTRIRLQDMIEDRWFQINHKPSATMHLEDATAAIEDDAATLPRIQSSSSFINAFQLIAMSDDLDLSSLFEQQEDKKQKTRLGSNHTVVDTMKKIEAAAMDASLSVERENCIQMKMRPTQKLGRTSCSRSHYDLSTEVIEVAPMNCVVEITKSACYRTEYNEFCRSLSILLAQESKIL